MKHLLNRSCSLLSLLLLQVMIILLFQDSTTILAIKTVDKFFALKLCSDDTLNYTSRSQFKSNLKNHLLPSLIINGSVNGFFNTSSGEGPDTVYGLVQCRGDIPMVNCSSCLNIVAVEVLEYCPYKKDAYIRSGYCVLRYSNINFFSRPKYDYVGKYTWRNNKNASDLVEFNQQLVDLMTKLTASASSDPSRFMVLSSPRLDDLSKIYGLVQCTQDLSSTDCSECLDNGCVCFADFENPACNFSYHFHFPVKLKFRETNAANMFEEIPDCCRGKKGAWVSSASCQIWYRDIEFFYPPRLLPPPPPLLLPPPLDSKRGRSKGSSSSIKVNVAIVTLAVVSALLILTICVLLRRKAMMRKTSSVSRVTARKEINSEESLQVDLVTLVTATNNFSAANKLGEGGFGAVYKGDFSNGEEIAVKRLSTNSGQGSQEFKNEVVFLHKLQHRNLVKLLGYCLEGEEKLLIYEYLPNRSLDYHLFDPTKRGDLLWEKRYQIIGGIARGLLYLHEDSRLRIIHRDLKAGNILLDGEMNAKIADFGMAKLFGNNQTQGNTSRVGGTFGYMAPEYAQHGLFSVKSDVFSFGVLLLEIVSGRRITHFNHSAPRLNLLSSAWKHWREGTPLKLVDSSLDNKFPSDEMIKSIKIGLLCVQENIENRPTMLSVVLMLNSYSYTLPTPSQPAVDYTDSITGSTTIERERETDQSYLSCK